LNNAVGCLTISRMSDCLPCRKEVPYPIVSAESVPSLIANLTYALYGAITKSLVAGKIVWNIPCDPNNTAQVAGVPRMPGEGLLCYIIRCFTFIIASASQSVPAPSSEFDFSGLPYGLPPVGNIIYFAARDQNSIWTISYPDDRWKVIQKSALS